jgi:predicted membrane protein
MEFRCIANAASRFSEDITPKTVRLLFLQWAVTANAICRAGFTSKKNVKIK